MATSDYLDLITRGHTFTESNGLIKYDELPLFDLGDGGSSPMFNYIKCGSILGGPVWSLW